MSCPFEFQENCVNYEVKCHLCKCISPGGEGMYYIPLADIGTHPYWAEYKVQQAQLRADARLNKPAKNKQASYYSRQGRIMERKIINSIDGSELTFNSGHTNHDSDGKLTLADTTYRLSHKTRFNNRNVFGPTRAEWDKAKSDGTDIWLTTSPQLGTLVTMSKDIFDELIRLIRSSS